MRFVADRVETLMEALRRALPAWRGGTLRQRLRFDQVGVNGQPVRRANHPLAPGDVVTLDDHGPTPSLGPGRVVDRVRGCAPFPILYEDTALVVVDKPSGLRSVSDAREGSLTVPKLLKQYYAARRVPEPGCWVVHRLDRATSGVLALARSHEAKRMLVASWGLVEKTYFAVTEGIPDPPEGWVDEPLREGAGLFVRVARGPGSEAARTGYRVVAAAGGRALVAVWPETGRKHQIRVHLAWLGTPVAGDERYGDPAPPPGCPRRLYLHAAVLTLPHPVDGRRLTFSSPVPRAFYEAGPFE